MHPRSWLAYAVICDPAFSATVPKLSRGEDSLATSPLKLILPRSFSAATTNDSYSQTPSYLNDVPLTNLLSLNDTSPSPSNSSAPLHNLPLGYDIPKATNSAPQCNGAVYGTDLDRNSCFDAWRNMGWTPERVSWGPRGTSHSFQYRLPYRWSSGKYGIRSRVVTIAYDYIRRWSVCHRSYPTSRSRL